MPIIRLGDQRDIGKSGFQYHLLQQDFEVYDANVPMGQRQKILGPNVYATYLEYEGLCIRDFERNGYDDSDFYMVVWDPVAKEPKTIEFASTRGWSYPCYASSPDATPEVLQDYANYQYGIEWLRDRQVFEKRIKALCDFRRLARDNAKYLGFPSYRFYRLRTLSAEIQEKLIWLLTANIRSDFKKKLRSQVVAWLNDPAPKYTSPLSPKQLEWV